MRSLRERKSISGRGGDSVEIRAFEKGDLDRMVEIWNEVVRAGDAFPQTDELDEDQAADFFSAQTRTAVADDDGRVVGLYILHPNNVGRCAHTANASYAVDPSVRGKGLGRALVQDSLDHLEECGFRGLQFNAVVASNAGALSSCRRYPRRILQRRGRVRGYDHLLPCCSGERVILIIALARHSRAFLFSDEFGG